MIQYNLDKHYNSVYQDVVGHLKKEQKHRNKGRIKIWQIKI